MNRDPDADVAVRPVRLFESAVDLYARYRTGYPAREVQRLADRVGLNDTTTAIDVGCGTGQLSIPLSRYAARVVAVDPLARMLEVGRDRAEAAGRTNIDWLLGDSSNLVDLVAPGAHVATFAASFHWTDRAEVTRSLDGLLDATGSIVTINDDLEDDEQPAWVDAITELRNRYLGKDHTAGTDPFTRSPVSHRTILENSPFASVDELTWQWTRHLTIEDAVGLQFTYSFSTPAAYGRRAQDFASDVRASLLELHPDGLVPEPFRVKVLIGTRPGSAVRPSGR